MPHDLVLSSPAYCYCATCSFLPGDPGHYQTVLCWWHNHGYQHNTIGATYGGVAEWEQSSPVETPPHPCCLRAMSDKKITCTQRSCIKWCALLKHLPNSVTEVVPPVKRAANLDSNASTLSRLLLAMLSLEKSTCFS